MNDMKSGKKQEAKFLVVTVIAVAVLIVGVIGASYAYFAAYVSGTVSTTATIATKTVDNCVVKTITATASVTANQTNFAQGAGSRSAATSGNVMMHARNDAEAKCCYTAKVEYNAVNFKYVSGTTPEMVISVTRNGATLVNNVDITNQVATKYITNAGTLSDSSVVINGLSTTADGTTYDNWAATLTFVNNSFNQNAQMNKTATLKLTLTPTATGTALSGVNCS